MDNILQHIEKSHDEWLKTENISFEEKRIRAQIFLEQLWYIQNDNLSQSTLYRLGKELMYIKENPSQSNDICNFLEEVAEWGYCLKRLDKVWPCIPSKPLTKTEEICFENQQLHICYEYLTRSGYFADCAVSHAIRMQDNIIRHYEDCELEFSDIVTIQSRTLHTNKTLSDLENRFLRVMKELLLHRMKSCPQKYSKSDIQFCLNEQIFSPDDLLAKKIIKEDFLYHSYEDNSGAMLDHPEDSIFDQMIDGTDVLFIGLPSTGRTCMNISLLKSAETYFTSNISMTPYISKLRYFQCCNLLPYSTPTNTALQLGISIEKDNYEHSINLVEISGDAVKEICINPNPSFDDMDIPSTRLLTNGNHKILFIVIDPTCSVIRVNIPNEDGNLQTCNLHQEDMLLRFIDKLSLSQNNHTLRKIDEIHIIISKYDTLKENTNATEFLKSHYGKLLGKITHLCKSKSINISPDHTVQVIPFCLGHLYAGGYCDYESQHSVDLLDYIVKATLSKKKNGNQFIKKLIGLFKN